MKKENIPFIFKYLLRWVPGLKINAEGGDTPIPPIEEYLFEEGQPFYTVFFNTDLENPDFTSLDWSEAIDVTLDSLTVSVLKLVSLEWYGQSQPLKFDFWIQKMLAGTQLGPTLFLDQDAYFLCAGKLDLIISGESNDPVMIYVDPHYYDLISIYQPSFGPGWNTGGKVDEISYLGLIGIQYNGSEGNEPISLITDVNLEQDKWKAFMSPLPFERKEIQENDIALGIFYNPDITPDLTLIDWDDTSGSKIMDFGEGVKFAPLIYDQSFFGVIAIRFEKGDISIGSGGATYHLDEDAYGIYLGWVLNISDPIYADENYVKLLKAMVPPTTEQGVIVQNMVPGWDPIGRGNHFEGYAFLGGVGNNEMCKMKGQDVVVSVLSEKYHYRASGISFQDIWKDYLSNQPFKYNKIDNN